MAFQVFIILTQEGAHWLLINTETGDHEWCWTA